MINKNFIDNYVVMWIPEDYIDNDGAWVSKRYAHEGDVPLYPQEAIDVLLEEAKDQQAVAREYRKLYEEYTKVKELSEKEIAEIAKEVGGFVNESGGIFSPTALSNFAKAILRKAQEK